MNILVAGGSGAVGSQIIKQLSHTEHSVFALVRKQNAIPKKYKNVQQIVFNFETASDYEKAFSEILPDILIIALGTTMKKAGNVEAFNKVDRDYPIQLIQTLLKTRNPKAVIGLVSSVGADNDFGTYLKAKHAVEKAIFQTGLRYTIVRPSFLIADRQELRPAEFLIDKVFAKPYLFFVNHLAQKNHTLWKYAPIPVQKVAKALLSEVLKGDQNAVLEGLDLQ